MSIIIATKRQLHRDICADPVLHGLVINLYLNGEQYPQRVEDYFPLAAVDEPDLAHRMTQHIRDEDKHIALYIKSLEKLEQPVIELPEEDIFNHVVRSYTDASFAMDKTDSRQARQEKLAHFFAHVHFLEQRIAHSLEFHIDACAQSASCYAEKAVAIVLNDEIRHACYTRDAVMELLPRSKALEVLALHKRAEAKANMDFSARQLTQLLSRYSNRFPKSRRWLYRLSGHLQQRLLAYT